MRIFIFWTDELGTLREKVLLQDFSSRAESFRDRMSLAATITEMLDNGFFKSFAELYTAMFDRPSQAIKGYDHLHSHGEGSCSYSETPHVSNHGSAVDWEPTGILALGVNDPVLKNKVSIDDIPEYEKNAFCDISDGHINAFDFQKIKAIMAILHSKTPDDISGGSNGLYADGINSPPGQFVSQQQSKEYIGGELPRKKPGFVSGGSNGIRDDGTKGDNLHSYGEGSSSHSKAPRLFSDRLVVDQELRRTRAMGFDDPALKNKVSTDISEYGKNAFDDSDVSYQQMKELISAGSNVLHVDGMNSPPIEFIPSVVNQQQREEYIGGVLDRKKQGWISGGSNGIRDDGINSSLGQHVSIDIPTVNQQWKEYIGNELDRNKRDCSLITKSTLAITAPAAGTLLNTAISGSSHTSWIVNFVGVATVIGFAFALASIGLRRVNPMLSGIMTKLGAVSTASAIILALGLTVLPAVAWTAGVVACLRIAIGVSMA